MFEFLVSAEQVQANLDNSEWLILDVRHDLADHQAGRRAYEQGHIPGAVFLDHEVDLAAPKTGLNGRHPLPSRQELAQLCSKAACVMACRSWSTMPRAPCLPAICGGCCAGWGIPRSPFWMVAGRPGNNWAEPKKAARPSLYQRLLN